MLKEIVCNIQQREREKKLNIIAYTDLQKIRQIDRQIDRDIEREKVSIDVKSHIFTQRQKVNGGQLVS